MSVGVGAVSTGSWPRRKPRALLVPEETAMKWQKAGNHSCYPNIKASYYQQRAAPSKHRRTIGLGRSGTIGSGQQIDKQ